MHEKYKIVTLKGSNQRLSGQINEKIIISLIRKKGSLSKANLTKLTNLSPQSITDIVKRLIKKKLIIEGKKLKGKKGQPSTPLILNPNGAFSIGIKIGRRSCDLMLMCLDGSIKKQIKKNYEWPNSNLIFNFLKKEIPDIINELNSITTKENISIGIAMPDFISSWETVLAGRKNDLSKWNNINVKEKISEICGIECTIFNDVTSAALAEMHLGNNINIKSFFYIYIGSFIGGGLVLENKLYHGDNFNAGSIASLPLGITKQKTKKQLLNNSSLFNLEDLLIKNNINKNNIYSDIKLNEIGKKIYFRWEKEIINSLAFTILSATSFLDINNVIIDSALPEKKTSEILKKITPALKKYNDEGLYLPKINQGSHGYLSRVIGASFIPFYKKYYTET